jgi:hypothetical protein
LFITRVQVFPGIPPDRGGGFTPRSFDHLMHLEVTYPGLDPAFAHTLVEADVLDGGSSAELTLHSSPRGMLALDRHLRVVTWQPAAHVRGHDPEGNVIVETKLDAPLHPGQVVEVGGKPHRVAPAEHHELWPHRDKATGVCRGAIDWQHVTLIPEDPPPAVPQPETRQA